MAVKMQEALFAARSSPLIQNISPVVEAFLLQMAVLYLCTCQTIPGRS